MKCYYPQISPVNRLMHPCGYCLPCRINARNARAGRILLESLTWKYSYFVTLTYAPDTVRFLDSGDLVLQKKDLQNFLKRYRKNTSVKIKYFAVGEYGDKFNRPHYHLALFTNMSPPEVLIEVNRAWSLTGQSERKSLNISKDRRLIGRTDVRYMEENRAQYVAQYTTKKILSDRLLPDGVPAEFAIMSKHPPIGHVALIRQAENIIKFLKNTTDVFHGSDSMTKSRMMRDFFQGCYRLNGRKWPYDKYARNLFLKMILSSKELDKRKKELVRESYYNWINRSSYDQNQEAKSRHLALVKTEKWSKKRKEKIKKSNL